jgi:hypothetical protein
MSGPLAGDELTTALIPVADRLISAVHAVDPDAVAACFTEAANLAGADTAGEPWDVLVRHLDVVRTLAGLLAAWCSEDHAAPAALGWTLDPTAYLQFRSRADALTASLRAGRTALAQLEGTEA